MATIQPNLSLSLSAQLSGPTGPVAQQQQQQIAGTNFGSIESSLAMSQQMLSSLVQLQASWVGIGSGLGIGDGTTGSLGAALSGQYRAMTFGAPGNAADLMSLQSDLRGSYGGLAGGVANDFSAMAAPLAGSYAGLMQIQGMPATPPLNM